MIRYKMMVSPIKERQENAAFVKDLLPELEIINADINKCDLFMTYIENIICKNCDGIVMMEDDILLCKNFKCRVESSIQEHENDVIQFFSKPLAKNLERGYKNGKDFSGTVCNYYPKSFCEVLTDKDYIAWFRSKKIEPWIYPIDTYISHVLSYTRTKFWMELPFYAQHLALKSSLGSRSCKRQTIYFIDDLEKE